MVITTIELASTGIKVANIAHGLMMMTWKDPVVPDEQCFESIKAGLDLAGPGEKIILNSAEFYGYTPREGNLQLLNRFFTKYPEYRDRAFIAVKGGVNLETLRPDGSPELLRQSAENIKKTLGFKPDVFQCARQDKDRPVEETVGILKGLAEEGLFDYIGLSEVSEATLRRASAVHPIALVEIEISPWSYEEETRKVIQAGKELDVTILGYSPLGRGFLVNDYKPGTEFKDIRAHSTPRLAPEALEANAKVRDSLTKISTKLGITNAQLCLAWVASLGPHVVPLPGSSSKSRTLENFSASNVHLSEAELKEINEAIEAFEVVGDRYSEGVPIWT